MKTKTAENPGFTLVEIMIVVAILGLLAAIVAPNFVRARLVSQKNGCIFNLKKIEIAKASFVLDRRMAVGMAVSMDDLYSTNRPVCPGGGKYSPGQVGVNPSCTYTGHALEGSESPQNQEAQEIRIGNGSYIKIGRIATENGTMKFTLKTIERFETAHPDLKITGRQVVFSASNVVMGILLWHEPRTRAIALEKPTRQRPAPLGTRTLSAQAR